MDRYIMRTGITFVYKFPGYNYMIILTCCRLYPIFIENKYCKIILVNIRMIKPTTILFNTFVFH